MFDLFVQQRQSIDRSRGGQGLGLAIVRNLVQMHEGRITVQSAGVGHGSEFLVALPAIELKAITPPSPARSPALLSRPGGKRVLVVGDNEEVAEVLRSALEELGYA